MSDHIQAEINPRRVTHYFPRRSRRAKWLFALDGLGLPRALKRGGWDRRVFPVESHPTYRLMSILHDNDFCAEACHESLVQYYIERGRDEAAARAHADRRIDFYMDTYGALCLDLLQQGYRAEASDNQVGVAIDRHGMFVKVWEGHHRFALVHLLALASMTVEVRWVHLAWYRRFARGRGGFSEGDLRRSVSAAVERA